MLSHGGSYLGIRIVGWMGRNEWDGARHGGQGQTGKEVGSHWVSDWWLWVLAVSCLRTKEISILLELWWSTRRRLPAPPLPYPPTCTIPRGGQKKTGEIADFWEEVQNSGSWVTGRLKMMGLCLEVGWVNTYLSRFFWRLQHMDLGSVRWDKKGKRSVDIRVARHAHLGTYL